MTTRVFLLLALLSWPASLAQAEVVPATHLLEIAPPVQASVPAGRHSYFGAAAVNLGAAGFAAGWDTHFQPEDDFEVTTGFTSGRHILRGGRLAEPFFASTSTEIPGGAQDISLAKIGEGRFVAVWFQTFDFGEDVWFRRFEKGFRPIDPEAVRVAERVDFRADCNPRVASNGDGLFVIVWKRGLSPWGGEKVSQTLAQVFGADGQPVSPEIAVTEPRTDSVPCDEERNHPQVAMDAAGSFVVLGTSPAGPGIWGWRFDRTGQPLGGRFRVGGTGGEVHMEMLPSGDFVAAWRSPRQAGTLLMSRFTADGRRVGPLARVPAGDAPAMAMDGSGRVALFWLDGRRTALQVFDASLARLSPVLFDSPVTHDPVVRIYTRVGVAFGDNGRILTVWVGPYGRRAPDSILGRIWKVR